MYSLVYTNETIDDSLNKKFAEDEILPEEKIQKFHEEHLENIYSQLMDNIKKKSPAF